MPRLTRNRVYVIALATGALLVVLLDCATTRIGVLRVPYRVRLTSRVPVREAGAEVFSSSDSAEFAAQKYNPDDLFYRAPATALTGAPFEVQSGGTSRSGCLFVRPSSVHHRHLAVVAVLSDGRRVGNVVELPEPDPDREDDPEVTVALDGPVPP